MKTGSVFWIVMLVYAAVIAYCVEYITAAAVS